MNLKPLYDKVVLKKLDMDEKTKGGIIIPETAQELRYEGEVVAVGKGKVRKDGTIRPLDVQVGDTVYFSAFGVHDIVIDDEEYLIISEDEILAIVG